MKIELDIAQKQVLRLSQEMKICFQVLSMPYSQLIKHWNDKFVKSRASVDKIFLENIAEEKNFYDYLEEQIIYLNVSEKVKKNLIYCINNLNSRGFLELSDLEICQQLGINKKELEKLYLHLYDLEPYGVGAHNFRECIKIQLIKKGIWEDKIEDVLNNLAYIAEAKEGELLRKVKISKEKLEEYLIKIKSCNPKPSRGFSLKKVSILIPDFYLYIKNNKIIVEENASWKDKLYNTNNFQDNDIDFLRSCIEKRMETLKKILDYILEKQEGYFLHDDFLKTLHEKDIAEDLNLSISTISRAIQNKYIWTEKGIISFKSLFCYSEEKERIKEKLQQLLENEDKKKPLSDLQLAKKIAEELNLIVARRTITKYRENLGYLASSNRKI